MAERPSSFRRCDVVRKALALLISESVFRSCHFDGVNYHRSFDSADATLAAAKFTPTADGMSAVRKFEVHGIVVTEQVSTEDVLAASRLPTPTPTPEVSAPMKVPPVWDLGRQTPALTRTG
jgi:hypothetical protein